jgi:hypothetical protein
VSIFERSTVVTLFTLGLIGTAVLRCGPPEQCLRFSDCSVGLTCVEGTCVPEGATAADEGGISEAGAPRADASVVDSSVVDSGAVTDATGSGDATDDAATVPPDDSSDF